jgi:flagellar assembly protein FliH
VASQPAAKDRLTAYQRWELACFDAPAKAANTPTGPSEQELRRIREQARSEGFAAGYKEGGSKAAAEAERLARIADSLGGELQRLDERLAEDLLGLGLAIASQVLRQALKARPELILAVIHEVLGQLPPAHQHARLVLNPQDAATVRTHLGERLAQSGTQIVEEPHIGRGGCRLEMPECEIDATMERRWQRVIAAIGRDDGWIE